MCYNISYTVNIVIVIPDDVLCSIEEMDDTAFSPDQFKSLKVLPTHIYHLPQFHEYINRLSMITVLCLF